jgi:hypothetical protein
MNQTLPPPPEPEIHAIFLWLLALILLVAWGVAHRLSARFLLSRAQWGLGFVGRVVLGTVALWVFWQAVARHLVLETTWPLALNGLIGALAIEIVLALYQLEKRIVPVRAGKWLTVLRLLAVLAVLTILAQPVFSRKETRTVDRNVVILLDESESMQLADTAMPVGERLALAAYLGLGGLEGRPALAGQMTGVRELSGKLDAAAESVRPPDGVSEAASRELIEAKKETLVALAGEAEAWTKGMGQSLDEGREEMRKFPDDLKQRLRLVRRSAVDEFGQAVRQIREGVERGEGRKLRAALREAAAAANRAAQDAGPLTEAVDEWFYNGLPESVRAKISEGSARTRRSLALEALERKADGKASLLEQLQQKYTVRFMQFGKEAAEAASLAAPSAPGSAMRSRTDLTGALTKVQESWAPENLAGVVLLSDTRHNGALPPDEAARRLGLQGSPVCPVVVGSAAGARDASIVEVSHPQSVFLGDRVRVMVDLKLDRLRGQTVKVSLSRAGKVVREEKLEVRGDAWRTTVKFDDTPEEKGIFAWKVKIDAVEGEQFPQNNEWAFEAAVSDDRTNVLLIEDRPRWEFRYLRNLFDSRDKSVQLQYVLLHPDLLEGADPLPSIPAAAGRPFGQSEATQLPATPEEWRKFDVIILGDVPPDRVTPAVWQTIRDCVGNRGAMLVMVAGRNYMPHAFGHDTARDLIPVRFAASTEAFDRSPEPAYRLALTAEGRQSPVFSQSLSGLESARIWEQMPVLRWRHPHEGAKEGTQVLAWAQPVPVDAQGVELPLSPALATDADPAGELQRRKAMESKHALVVASQVDLGKVVMLNFDQTWRFRYGVGDTWHHRFWGQLLRWGAGESLPSGTAAVRLGTDLLTYEPGQPVLVRARLTDEQFRPLRDGKVKAAILRDGQPVASRLLEYRKDSQGLYEGQIAGPAEPGRYTVQLSGSDVERLASKDGLRVIEQAITVSAASNPVELGDLTVDPEMARKLAGLSGGMATGLADAAAVLPKFGPGTTQVEEQKETSLWDNWIVLAVAVGALTAEWMLRRRHALA